MNKFSNEETRFLTLCDLRGILHIGKTTAYKLVNQDGFPKVYIGRKILIPSKKFYSYMENHIGTKLSID